MKSRAVRALVYLAFALLLLYVFAPYVWLLTAALSPSANLAVKIPSRLTLGNFRRVFTGQTFRWTLNSLLISISTTVISLLLNSPGGYALSRATFRGRVTLMYGIILTRVIPATLIIVPLYSILLMFRLLDTYLGLILAYVSTATPLNLWILKGAADSIPRELEEAAEIDGASRIRILSSIILPLMRPGMGAAGAMTFIAAWSGFIMPLILLSTGSKYPIAIGLFTAFGVHGEIDYSQLATLCIVYMLPIIILYMSVRSAFARGLGSLGVSEK